MNQLTTLPSVTSGAVMEMTDASEVNMVLKQADAICRMFEIGRYKEDKHITEDQRRMLRLRNTAMRRLGQMYNSIPKATGKNQETGFLTRSQFAKDLMLNTADMDKLRAISKFSDEQFEIYRDSGGDALWIDAHKKLFGEASSYGKSLERTRQRVKSAFKDQKKLKELKVEVAQETPAERPPLVEVPTHPEIPRVPTPEPVHHVSDNAYTHPLRLAVMMSEVIDAIRYLDYSQFTADQRADLYDEADNLIGALSDLQRGLQR